MRNAAVFLPVLEKLEGTQQHAHQGEVQQGLQGSKKGGGEMANASLGVNSEMGVGARAYTRGINRHPWWNWKLSVDRDMSPFCDIFAESDVTISDIIELELFKSH